MSQAPSIVLSGALANKPGNGGAAWTRLSWALGFRRLGYDVRFVEQISPSTCVNREGTHCAVDDSINLAYFTAVTRQFDLDATLVVEGENRAIGRPLEELIDAARAAEMLVNISGHLTIETLKSQFQRRVFVDLDPGYTQFWLAEGLAQERLRDHGFYFSVGGNIGQPFCSIPTGGITWRPIRQPVVLDEWPVVESAAGPIRFTTIASWRGPLGRVQHGDTTFGVKAHEFRKFVSLPSRTAHRFEIALEADPADCRDVALLRSNGWSVVDPASVACDPNAFRAYVQRSSAECSVAQGIYVETESGWFSDRTVRYLASGKPALVQDTGWSRSLPTGRGLIPFRTIDDAVAGAERIAGDYADQARAARVMAEEFFDSSRVLTPLISTVCE